MTARRVSGELLLLGITTGALAAGGVAWLADARTAADACWLAGTATALAPSLWWVLAALRARRTGVDLIAVLSLVGTIAVHEYVAGALIGVMLATGRTLDAAAERRATRDLRALLARAPRTARRRRGDAITVVPLEQVVPGDLLVVGAGEVVPVDGTVSGAAPAVLDESALTGESEWVERPCGDQVRSGVVNAGAPFELTALTSAEDSTYAAVVRLAQQAAADTAPVVRLADRYATWFLPLSLGVAAAAWLVTGRLVRAVAVLVVATPCPLLLAAPVAIVSGMSRAARRGVVIRSGSALETLGRARTMLLDKTGTLTAGRPAVVEIATAPGWSGADVLRLAASAEQVSTHVFAAALVREAIARGLRLSVPEGSAERAGRGVTATIDGARIEVGNALPAATVPAWGTALLNRAALDGSAVSWVVRAGLPIGVVLLRDPLRRDAHRTVRRLRVAGIRRLVMLTGDRPGPAREVATVLGLDGLYAGQSPADKLAAAQAEARAATTVMVGDGVNDAPALAAATVGVAMGARGATASSEAADIVLTTDRLDRLAEAMEIARWSRRIAVQSAATGMALSLLAMVVAAFGWLPPAAGALAQEGIDVAVILNALRALRGGTVGAAALPATTDRLLHRFSAEHETLRDAVALLRAAADALLQDGPGPLAAAALDRADAAVQEQILPHEHAEEHQLYPALAAPLGSGEATVTMSRMHGEIERLAGRLHVHAERACGPGGIAADQVGDLLACLYGLHAVLRLHFDQEEEDFFTLASEAGTPEVESGVR